MGLESIREVNKMFTLETKKLDLHGVKHEDVKRKVIRFIEGYWDTDKELEIMTGNSQRMRGLVIEVIEEYKLTYSIGRLYSTDTSRIITWV